MASVASQLRVRPLNDSDHDAVLDLINADRILGQPRVTSAMLGEVISGRSQVDAGWWAELDKPAVDVLVDAADRPHGVVSYAARQRDQAGVILWLNGREQREVVAALVDRALSQLGDRPLVEAFAFASALTTGLEALPIKHRPETARVLRAARFVPSDLWRYMHRRLPAADLPSEEAVQVIDEADGHYQLRLSDGGQLLAEANVSVPTSTTGVLWWISVDVAARRRGLGIRVLGSALRLLTKLGATEVILYVDDDATADDPERGRGAANQLYDHAGFAEVDRLHSYQLRR